MQELIPLSTISNSWLVIGGANAHDCIDDGQTTNDGNATYLRGGPVDTNDGVWTMSPGITTGGVYTGWSVDFTARRFGVQFNPDKEPRVLVELYVNSIFVTSQEFLLTSGNVFDQYTMPLTPRQAQDVYEQGRSAGANVDLVTVRMRNAFVAPTNTVRITALSMFMADPLILIDPCEIEVGFGQLGISLGGTGSRRGRVVGAGGVGQVAANGGRRQVNRCP